MLSWSSSWRCPDDAPRGQARRVRRGHRIDPAGILNDPPAYQLVRVDGPARSPRAEEPTSDDRDPGALMALLVRDDRSPRARDIDLG